MTYMSSPQFTFMHVTYQQLEHPMGNDVEVYLMLRSLNLHVVQGPSHLASLLHNDTLHDIFP